MNYYHIKSLKRILFLFAFLLPLFLNAQSPLNYEAIKSEVFKDEHKNSYLVSIDQDKNGGAIVVRSYVGNVFNLNNAGYYIEHYSSDMKLIKNYAYPLEDSSFLGIFINDETIYTFNVTYIPEYEGYSYTVSTAGIDDFVFTKKELFRVKGKEIKHPGLTNIHIPNEGRFSNLILNDKKTAFMLFVHNVPGKNTVNKMYVYDMALNQKIEHTFDESINCCKFTNQDFEISNDGSTAYILRKIKTEESRKKDKGARYEYDLMRVTASESESLSFSIGDHYAASLKAIMKSNSIACVGFYSDKDDNRHKGICYFEVDSSTMELKTSKYNPFTEEFLIDKYGKKKNKELKMLVFKDIFINNQNEIIFNAEENYKIMKSNNSGGMAPPTPYVDSYNYDDIICAKISDNGDLIWARNINKSQSSDNPDAFLSYTSTTIGDDTFFFINTSDEIRRLRNDRIEFGQTSRKQSNLNIIRINKDGDFDFKEILNGSVNEVPFMVAIGAKINYSNNIYFMGRFGKNKQLLKITL